MFTMHLLYVLHLYCCSAWHQQMVQTFWHTNRIRNPKTAASGCLDSTLKVSSDGQKVGHTILEDYQNDIKKRFRNSNAPLQWKEWLELQKIKSKKTAVKSSTEDGIAVSLPNTEESFKLQESETPSLSASSVGSSVSLLAWRMEAFFISAEDYQRYTRCLFMDDCMNGIVNLVTPCGCRGLMRPRRHCKLGAI